MAIINAESGKYIIFKKNKKPSFLLGLSLSNHPNYSKNLE